MFPTREADFQADAVIESGTNVTESTRGKTV
jgi:hypothetical protein